MILSILRNVFFKHTPSINNYLLVIKLSHTSPKKTALVVEGGAMRSVYSSGLLDGFLSKKFNPFDIYIGVSAGAFNLLAYILNQPGLSLYIYKHIATNRNFISYLRFIRGGHLLDLDWLMRAVLSSTSIDIASISKSTNTAFACLTDVETGQAIYPQLTSDNIKPVLKATMALPLIYREFPMLDGRPMTDGGVADGIPVAKVIELGARKIMVVRSRRKDYIKKDTIWHRIIRWKLPSCHELSKTMSERTERFNQAISIIRKPPNGIEIYEVCPPTEFVMRRFSRQYRKLLEGYNAGLRMSDKVVDDWVET